MLYINSPIYIIDYDFTFFLNKIIFISKLITKLNSHILEFPKTLNRRTKFEGRSINVPVNEIHEFMTIFVY